MDGPLAGLRIIDSTTVLAMPTAMHILADMGAEVIKVESHTLVRTAMGVYPDNDPGSDPWNRDSSFHALNRSKLGVTLDLKQSKGIELFKELIRKSDVLAENNRAGTIERLGLGFNELKKVKPDLVYISNTGFGQTGPWKRYAGVGSMFELTCGLSQFTGYANEGPRRIGNSWFDLHVGWIAVFAILSALLVREKTGQGQYIDLAMYQVGVSTLGDTILDYIANHRIGSAIGNRHPYYAPHGIFPCRGNDKWIAIVIKDDRQWESLCEAMDNPPWASDPRFVDPIARLHNQNDLDRHLGEWTSQYSHMDLTAKLQERRIMAMAVMNNKELLTDPHLTARNFFERIHHPPESGIGTRAYVGRPWKMSKTPARIRGPAPALGEHNEYVFGNLLGLSRSEITRLYEEGILGKQPVNRSTAGRWDFSTNNVESGHLAGYDPDYKKVLGFEE